MQVQLLFAPFVAFIKNFIPDKSVLIYMILFSGFFLARNISEHKLSSGIIYQ